MRVLFLDFDGDGMGDLSVFRPTDGTWHFFRSSDSTYVAFPFGISTDKPVPADYDGDGKTDVAIFRGTADASQPDFFILLTGSQTFQGASWGTVGDVPVTADYDGDGRADIGIYRPSTSEWYLLQTTAGFFNVTYGFPDHQAVEAAYVP